MTGKLHPERLRTVMDLRRSNATRPKPYKVKRKQRTRQGAKRAAIREERR